MLDTTREKDLLVDVGPTLDVSQLFSLGELELIREFDLLSFFVEHEETFWNDCRCMENSSKLSTEQMSLFTFKGWVRVDLSIQVTGEDVLDETSLFNVLGAAIWELNPIVQQIVCDPEDGFVDTFSTRFHARIL